MDTPASTIRRNGSRVNFKQVRIGETFECNGNVWTKRTTKTAVGVWPACLPSWAYFKVSEQCHVER